ncbi:MAG TPA: cytochrome P450 [Steroidobacteraceae bacterium]|jgi:cytochrome P450|nr:cytochrome P450 [Steroidobacteraceae bacterium]
MTAAREPQDFDPLIAESFDSPHEVYRELRARCPVAHSDAWGGFWALTRYAEVQQALQQSSVFITSVQNVVPRLAFTGRRPPLHLDPPEHTPYRRALNPLFKPERIARLEPKIRALAASLLQAMIARGGGDLCSDYSSHLTIRVFAEWMDVPESMVPDLQQVGRAYNIAVQSANGEMVRETSLKLYDMARAMIASRRQEPRDPATDPTAALLAARIDGAPFPDEMILGTIRQVLVVGIIAPTIVVGSIAVHLARDPPLQQRLRADLSAMPRAIEEFLRLYTPYRGFARTANRDVEINGRAIREGEPIALLYASANRDEAVFEHADQFDMNRPNIDQHLAFGMGPHMCAGMPLARLELRIAVEELLKHTRGFELSGEPTQTRFPEIGALSVPLRFL